MQKTPEAVNLWLGNSKSVSALHQDNYENIYCQIIGKKHFVLLPPLSSPCVAEQDLKPASYIHRDGKLDILEEEGMAVRFPTWNPDNPNERATRYSCLASPIRITLEPGDILYLPALWLVTWLMRFFNAMANEMLTYFKVSQSFTILLSRRPLLCNQLLVRIRKASKSPRLNTFRYDMFSYSGSFLPCTEFIRNVASRN